MRRIALVVALAALWTGAAQAVVPLAPVGKVPAPALWCGVAVVPEMDCPTYDGDLWSYPPDLDVRYGQQTADGQCFSPYDGRVYPDCAGLDIEHLRSRHSAAKGGGCYWSRERKRAFASDPLNISVAPKGINRYEKKDRDPDRWLPAVSREWFAWRYLAVTRKHGLTITPATRDALAAVVGRRCP